MFSPGNAEPPNGGDIQFCGFATNVSHSRPKGKVCLRNLWTQTTCHLQPARDPGASERKPRKLSLSMPAPECQLAKAKSRSETTSVHEREKQQRLARKRDKEVVSGEEKFKMAQEHSSRWKKQLISRRLLSSAEHVPVGLYRRRRSVLGIQRIHVSILTNSRSNKQLQEASKREVQKC